MRAVAERLLYPVAFPAPPPPIQPPRARHPAGDSWQRRTRVAQVKIPQIPRGCDGPAALHPPPWIVETINPVTGTIPGTASTPSSSVFDVVAESPGAPKPAPPSSRPAVVITVILKKFVTSWRRGGGGQDRGKTRTAFVFKACSPRQAPVFRSTAKIRRREPPQDLDLARHHGGHGGGGRGAAIIGERPGPGPGGTGEEARPGAAEGEQGQEAPEAPHEGERAGGPGGGAGGGRR